MKSSVVGIDLAKNVFSVCALNHKGKVLSRRNISRAKLAKFIQTTEKTLIAMEACGGAHHWARMASEAGHEVKMSVRIRSRIYCRTELIMIKRLLNLFIPSVV